MASVTSRTSNVYVGHNSTVGVTVGMGMREFLVVASVATIQGSLDDCGSHGLDHCSGMYCGSGAVYHSVESVVRISSVCDSAHCTIGLHQAVFSLHHVTVTLLPLALDVSCVGIVHSVVKAVFRISLEAQILNVTFVWNYFFKCASIIGKFPTLFNTTSALFSANLSHLN